MWTQSRGSTQLRNVLHIEGSEWVLDNIEQQVLESPTGQRLRLKSHVRLLVDEFFRPVSLIRLFMDDCNLVGK